MPVFGIESPKHEDQDGSVEFFGGLLHGMLSDSLCSFGVEVIVGFFSNANSRTIGTCKYMDR